MVKKSRFAVKKVGEKSHNQFDAMEEEKEEQTGDMDKQQNVQSSKEWVEETIGKDTRSSKENESGVADKGEKGKTTNNGNDMTTPDNRNYRQKGVTNMNVERVQTEVDTENQRLEISQVESMHIRSTRIKKTTVHNTLSERNHNDLRELSNLFEETEAQSQHSQNSEEDEDMEVSIQHICMAGDLSPRHTDNLKNRAKKNDFLEH
uniref:Uncharacterized protein n=1 Tax=Solanum lycopersicum TaxID=4081 RepID=A0A3Q7GIS0_SOLLC